MSDVVAVRGSHGASQTHAALQRTVAPAVDVFENGDEVLVVADIPGVPSESIDVRVENDTLTLEAKRQSTQSIQKAPALSREYDEPTFARAFRIPAGIDAANVSAEAKNGTLIVRLPKAAAAKPRKVVVH
jgi:HSP20 family protein